MWHPFVSPVVDQGDPNEVGPDEWNARHVERCFFNAALVAGRKSFLFVNLPWPFNVNESDTNYSITISSNTDEIMHWETKATTGFDVVSSNSASTALVDVKIARHS